MAKKTAAKRQGVLVSVDVARDFQETCKGRAVGRSMNDTASRLLHWFNRQAPAVQTAVVSDVDRGMERFYAQALRQLADELERKGSGGVTRSEKPGPTRGI